MDSNPDSFINPDTTSYSDSIAIKLADSSDSSDSGNDKPNDFQPVICAPSTTTETSHDELKTDIDSNVSILGRRVVGSCPAQGSIKASDPPEPVKPPILFYLERSLRKYKTQCRNFEQLITCTGPEIEPSRGFVSWVMNCIEGKMLFFQLMFQSWLIITIRKEVLSTTSWALVQNSPCGSVLLFGIWESRKPHFFHDQIFSIQKYRSSWAMSLNWPPFNSLLASLEVFAEESLPAPESPNGPSETLKGLRIVIRTEPYWVSHTAVVSDE